MALTNVWLAGYGGPAIGATAVWIAPNDGTVPAATQVTLVGWNGPVSGATPIWIAAYGGPPPAAIGAIPICISGWSGAVLVIPGSPVNTVAPAVTGTALVGSTLTCSTGTWTNSPTGYTYQWTRNGGNISGATSSTYLTVTADGGTSVGCVVRATNAISSNSASSNVLAILGVPANTAAPVASGSLTVGSTLSCTQGTWTNSPTSYAYQWQRGGANISGATSSSYVTVSADGGTSVGCLVTATNAAGSASQASNTLAIAGGVATSVWSSADAAANAMTLSNGGLTVTPSGAASWQSVRSSISQTSGKLYVEFKNTATINNPVGDLFGLASASFNAGNYLGASTYSFSVGPGGAGGGGQVSSGFTENYSPVSTGPALNDVYALAVDFAAGKVWLSKNNVWDNGSNPATASLPIVSFTPATVGALFAAMSFNAALGAGVGVWTLQSQPAQQTYLPPPGFQAWDGGPVTPPPSSVWSASDATAGSMTLTNGGLTVTPGAAGQWQAIRSTTSKTSGKFYVEFSNSVAATNWVFSVGLASAGIALGGGAFALGMSNYSVGIVTLTTVNVSSGFTKNYTPNGPDWQPAAGTVFALAIDFTAGSIWFADNNVWTNSSNPATGSLPAVSFVPATVGALFAAMDFGATGVGVWTLQATAASQKYAPPSGFTAWG